MKNKLGKKDRKWLTSLVYKKVIQNKLESLVHIQKNEASQTRKKRYARRMFKNQDSTQQNKSSTEQKIGLVERQEGMKLN